MQSNGSEEPKRLAKTGRVLYALKGAAGPEQEQGVPSMRNSEFWLSAETHSDRGRRRGGIGAIRIALLFGTMAVALALLLPPIASDHSREMVYAANAIDPMTTASISANSGVHRYTIRRSILQEPGTACIVSGVAEQGRC